MNAYRLLMEAMRQTGKIGIAKISIRSKSSLAAIRVLSDCLAIETIYYPDEVRPVSQVPGLPEAGMVNDKELDMAKLLISQLSTPFEPAKYTDDYRQRMLDLISHKIAGEEFHIAPARQESNVIDLMAALQASIEAVQHIPTDPGPSPSGSAAKPQTAAARKTPRPKQQPPLLQPLCLTKQPDRFRSFHLSRNAAAPRAKTRFPKLIRLYFL